ncbi:FHA domain-containing protein [Aerosakkonema funiforme]|uniref:FHA domain-containing protein n=1 Tax=Aerosakkonema funiforme TaxID=1246630 RepID=UPI0035B7EB73
MQLKLFLEQTNQSWTLKPNREYVIGSGSDCDIPLSFVNVVSDRHLKLSFNQLTNTWHAYDLGSSKGTFVDNQPITDYPIKTQTKIVLAGGIFLVATPEGAIPMSPPAMYAPASQTYSSVPPTQVTYDRAYRQSTSVGNSLLRVLTWGEYVEVQASQLQSWWDRVAIRYYLMTGLRNTPWIKFDGYVIPDFKEPAEKIAVGIEANLNQLKRYEDTDCHVVLLTDAHLTDSRRDFFSGIELFSLKRGGRRDFRRFCVVSHHRIRTYVIVDNYGTDLFIGRLTRFESQPDGFVPAAILGLIFLIVAILTFFTNFLSTLAYGVYAPTASIALWSLIILTGLWVANFIAVPWLMREFRILPRPGNTLIIWLIILLSLWLFFGLLTFLFPS